jgi:ribulose-phosphate 3-epimerase
VVEAVKRVTGLPLDVHLMIEHADQYLEDFVKAGSDSLTVQVEACVHLHRTIQAIKELGVKAAVALNPSTPVSTIEWILEEVDMVLIMSVNPGFGGQKFIPQALQKIEELKSMIGSTKRPFGRYQRPVRMYSWPVQLSLAALITERPFRSFVLSCSSPVT